MKIYAELIRNYKNYRIKSLWDNNLKPKAGKSTLMASLNNNLIVDLEDGYKSLSAMVVNIKSWEQMYELRDALRAKMGSPEGEYPYKFITIDNATRIEELALKLAAKYYRETPMGNGWGLVKDPKNPLMNMKDSNGKPISDPKADVRTLPNGAGY